MNIYEVAELEREIELAAAGNDGEIPEELLQALVEAQTKSVQKIEGLVKYIRHLEMGVEMCDEEIKRIRAMKDRAEKRIESIKRYMTPFVKHNGKVEAGTFTLSVRKSTSVELADDFAHPLFSVPTTVLKHDKNGIKEGLKSGMEIPGARIVERDNLQIK